MYSDFSGVGVWLNGCGLILARYGHCSVSVCCGQDTADWSGYCRVVWTLRVSVCCGLNTTEWSEHCRVVWTLQSCIDTAEWYWHCSVSVCCGNIMQQPRCSSAAEAATTVEARQPHPTNPTLRWIACSTRPDPTRSLLTNQRLVSRSRDHFQPVRGLPPPPDRSTASNELHVFAEMTESLYFCRNVQKYLII